MTSKEVKSLQAGQHILYNIFNSYKGLIVSNMGDCIRVQIETFGCYDLPINSSVWQHISLLEKFKGVAINPMKMYQVHGSDSILKFTSREEAYRWAKCNDCLVIYEVDPNNRIIDTICTSQKYTEEIPMASENKINDNTPNLAQLLMDDRNASSESPLDRVIKNGKNKELEEKKKQKETNLMFLNNKIDMAFSGLSPEDKIWFIKHCINHDNDQLELKLPCYKPIIITCENNTMNLKIQIVFRVLLRKEGWLRKEKVSDRIFSLYEALRVARIPAPMIIH